MADLSVVYFTASILIVCLTGFTAALAEASKRSFALVISSCGGLLGLLLVLRLGQVVQGLLDQRRLGVLLLADRRLRPS